MGSSSIQFRGKENVLQAYESREIPAWALCQGKAMIFKHEGQDMEEASQALEHCLDMLATSSNAIYTLKVFEDATKIKSNTPDDGSFNFRLNLDTQEATVSAVTRMQNNNELLSRIAALEEQLQDQEEEEPENTAGLAGLAGILENPLFKPLIDQAVSFVAGSLFKQPAAAAMPSPSIAGVDPLQQLTQDEKILQAVQILKTKSATIGDDLLKLAAIAEKQPEQFTMLLSMLKNY